MSENLALWDLVSKTDPQHVKPITGKSYRGNSPKPHYLIHKATETFGPIGIGWGFEIVEDRILEGALISPDFHEQIHTAKVRVWYDWTGKRGTVEHVGQTLFSGKRKSGDAFTDEDAPKKSVTDALIKALSMIGFAGDIFMGRYDDSKYVAEINQEFRNEEKANGHKKRTRAEISDAASFKRAEHKRVQDDVNQITSFVELERYKREVLTPEFMAKLGNGQWGVEQMFARREAELLAQQNSEPGEELTEAEWLEKMQTAQNKDELLKIGADVEAALPEEAVDRLLPAFREKMKALKATHA